MRQLSRITGLEFLGDYRVRLTFSDGFAGALDLKPIMAGGTFSPLWNPALFQKATLGHGTLIWPNGADLCPDVLRHWCSIGRVCSQESLDSAFAETLFTEKIANDK